MELNHSGWRLLVEFPRDLSLGLFDLCYINDIGENIQCELGVAIF